MNKKSTELDDQPTSSKKRRAEDDIIDTNPPTPFSILHPHLNTADYDESSAVAESHPPKGETFIDFQIVSPWYGDNQIKKGIFALLTLNR